MLVELPQRALKVDPVARPSLQQHLHAFLQVFPAALLAHAVPHELQRAIAATQSHDEPAVAQDVQRGRLLSQAQGMVEGQDEHRQADVHPLRASGHGRGQHGGRRGQAVVGVVVLGEPDGVEPQLLGEDHLVDFLGDDLRNGPAGNGLQEVVGAEAHQSGGLCALYQSTIWPPM